MKNQHTPMTHSPASGAPYSGMAAPLADDYRQRNPKLRWRFNPWTGAARDAFDMGSDPLGRLIAPPGELLAALDHMKAEMNVCFQPAVTMVAGNFIVTDSSAAEALVRDLLNPEMYAHLVNPEIRNRARRALGITYQEPA